jgi:dihydroorotate dehydrogenase
LLIGLGFNNKGVDYLVNNLKTRKYKGVLGVNIGANKNSVGDERIKDYLIVLEKL